jgi:hypothetical protein
MNLEGVEEMVMDYSDELSWHLTGWSEENYAKHVRTASLWLVSYQAPLSIHCLVIIR